MGFDHRAIIRVVFEKRNVHLAWIIIPRPFAKIIKDKFKAKPWRIISTRNENLCLHSLLIESRSVVR